MKITPMMAALAFTASCSGVPDPDETGRIVGTLTDDGGTVTGCAPGQSGRTLTYPLSTMESPDGGRTVNLFGGRTWCCPTGTAFNACPGASLMATSCTGAWPGTTCPTTPPAPYVPAPCATDAACDSAHACTPVPIIGADGAVTSAPRQCLTRCTLPPGEAFGRCNNSEVCARAPNEPIGSRKGVCYPVVH